MHIDEWRHIAESNSLLQAADIEHPSPFTGQPTTHEVTVLEAGFHLFWGVFHQISGISWVFITRYFPSIIFMITILSVYIMARREGFGWEAAFFTCLIPTTVGIMGPAFLIPLAMALLFIAIALFIVFNFKTWWSYLVLLLIIGFLTLIHPPSAISLVIILVPIILINLKENFRHSLGIALVISIPFVVTLPLTYDLIVSTAQSLFGQESGLEFHDIPRIIKTYGYLPVGLALLGTFWLALKGRIKNYSLVFSLLVLLLMLAVFYTLNYGTAMMYLRGLVFMMLMLSIVAGAGLMALRKLAPPWATATESDKPIVIKAAGILLCLIIIGVALAIAIPDRQNTPYYHMIDKADYEAFVWIRDNIGEDYEKAILDPWKGTAFTAITEKYVYTKTHVSTSTKDKEAYDFLKNSCTDTDFLRDNGISIVYSQEACSNPDLVEMRENVYLLKEAGKQ